jgi:hypothetical protein
MPSKKPTTKSEKKKAVREVMKEYASGALHSGSKKGPKVKSRAQAVAIGLSESGQSRSKK